ncbi:hypothetical protein GQ457_01G024550 [Hibiscus cannabinus]
MEDARNGDSSASTSPPTPLPVSTGPGNQRYLFSRSPTPSPLFSPSVSSNNSAASLPLLHHDPTLIQARVTSAFSLDRKDPDELHHKSWNGWCKNAAIAVCNGGMGNSKLKPAKLTSPTTFSLIPNSTPLYFLTFMYSLIQFYKKKIVK